MSLPYELDPAMAEWRAKGWVRDPREFYKVVCDWDKPQPAAQGVVHLTVVSEPLPVPPPIEPGLAQAS